jgi:WD40 repeat protein
MIRRGLLILLALGLAACGTGGDDDTPDADPTPTDVIGVLGDFGQREDSVPVAPVSPEISGWTEPAAALQPDTVFRAQALGIIEPPGTLSTIFAYDFSADGTQIAVLNNTDILAYDLISGELLLNNTRQDAINIFYSPDKAELLTITSDGQGRAYDAQGGDVLATFLAHEEYGGISAYSDEGGLLAVAGTDGTVKVWDSAERTSLVTFTAHNGDISNMVFTADGERLITTGDDERVIVWDWRAREAVATIENGARAINLAVSPDGALVAVAAREVVTLWEADTGAFLYTLLVGPGGAADVLTFSPDSRYLVTGGDIPEMIVWAAETGDIVAMLPGVGESRVAAAFSVGSDLLLTSVLDGPVSLWDLTQVTEDRIPQANLNVGSERIVDVAFTPDGFLMLFFDATGAIIAWGVPPEAE